jgi:hypothetical protein
MLQEVAVEVSYIRLSVLFNLEEGGALSELDLQGVYVEILKHLSFQTLVDELDNRLISSSLVACDEDTLPVDRSTHLNVCNFAAT